MYYKCKADITRYAVTNKHAIVALTPTEDGCGKANVIKILPLHKYYHETSLHEIIYSTQYNVKLVDFIPVQTVKEL